MTDAEWTIIENALRVLPAQERWTPAAGEAYRTMLAGLAAGDVMRALARCSARGSTWRPTWAELLRATKPEPTDEHLFASPPRAWDLIEAAISRCPSIYDRRFTERHQAAVDWLRTQDEAVAAWAAERGLCGRGSLGAEKVHDDTWGGAVRKRLQGDYATVRDRAVERLQLGQPAFAERAFLVRGTGHTSGGIAELVERLRPVRELEAGEAA